MRAAYQQMIDYFTQLKARGAAMLAEQTKQLDTDPPADIGIFGSGSFPTFEIGHTYVKNELFSYQGRPGFVRQPHTAQAQWEPFTPGTESLYGARPRMSADGTFDYIYNMAATVGMRVRDGGKLYECIQAIDPMLYPPAEIPAHFEEVEDNA